jgi:hypothetical protein
LTLADELFLFGVLAVDGVEGKFEAVGGSELIEDAEEIIAHGVFAEVQRAGDVAVGEALGDEVYKFLLSLGEQAGALGVRNGRAGLIGERFDEVLELLVAGPNLTLMEAASVVLTNQIHSHRSILSSTCMWPMGLQPQRYR